MPADRDSLLRGVIEQAAEDAPRLVYADWLDEHGEADRAEFIRVQCELDALPPARPKLQAGVIAYILGGAENEYATRGAYPPGLKAGSVVDINIIDYADPEGPGVWMPDAVLSSWREARWRLPGHGTATISGGVFTCRPSGQADPHRERRAGLEGRGRELLGAHAAAWLGDATREATVFGRATPEQMAAGLVWRRGFVAELACHAADWPELGPGVVREQPVEWVTIHGVEPQSMVRVYGATRTGWRWSLDPADAGQPHHLPPEWARGVQGRRPLQHVHRSRRTALVACNAAALTWARAEALRRSDPSLSPLDAWRLACRAYLVIPPRPSAVPARRPSARTGNS